MRYLMFSACNVDCDCLTQYIKYLKIILMVIQFNTEYIYFNLVNQDSVFRIQGIFFYIFFLYWINNA